jgi:hypothetical protein
MIVSALSKLGFVSGMLVTRAFSCTLLLSGSVASLISLRELTSSSFSSKTPSSSNALATAVATFA